MMTYKEALRWKEVMSGAICHLERTSEQRCHVIFRDDSFATYEEADAPLYQTMTSMIEKNFTAIADRWLTNKKEKLVQEHLSHKFSDREWQRRYEAIIKEWAQIHYLFELCFPKRIKWTSSGRQHHLSCPSVDCFLYRDTKENMYWGWNYLSGAQHLINNEQSSLRLHVCGRMVNIYPTLEFLSSLVEAGNKNVSNGFLHFPCTHRDGFFYAIHKGHKKSLGKALSHSSTIKLLKWALKIDDNQCASLIARFTSMVKDACSIIKNTGSQIEHKVYWLESDGDNVIEEIYGNDRYVHSCMTENPNDCLSFYSLNHDKCGIYAMFIKVDDANVLVVVARAMLWRNCLLGDETKESDDIFFDRIFVPNNGDYCSLPLTASAYGGLARQHLLSLGYEDVSVRNVDVRLYSDDDKMPYMDNMKYLRYNHGEGRDIILANNARSLYSHLCQTTSGSLGYTCCRCGSTVGEDDVINYDGEHYCPDCVVYCEPYDEYRLTEDCVYSDYHCSYIPECDALEFYNRQGYSDYALADDIRDDGNYVYIEYRDAYYYVDNCVMTVDEEWIIEKDAHTCPYYNGDDDIPCDGYGYGVLSTYHSHGEKIGECEHSATCIERCRCLTE